MRKKSHEIDMTQGPILPLILRFAIPLIFSDMLQLLYNAADVAVVGRFASSEALAAVSSSGSLIGVMTQVFIGLSLGASVLVARHYGSGDRESVHTSVHTAITLSLISGLVIMVAGIALARPLLIWMNTPADVLDLATVYLRIYFSGSLFSMFFNYGAAVMRAVGDSRRPTTYLMISGAVNVVFNLLFVIVFDMSVVGVALATVISQLLSAALVAVNLLRTHTVIRVDVRRLRIVPREMAAQLRIGFPVGIQKSMYTISNVILQTAVNGFGSVTMAGSGAAANLESFLYAGMSCFYTAVLTFTSQNMGARQVERMKKAAPICASCSFLTGLTIGSIVMLFRETLLSFYTTDPQVIAMAVQRMWVTVLPAAIIGASDAIVGCMRGMGQVFKPMLISIAFVCGLRLIWVYVFFPLAPSLGMLYLSYPISWSIMLVAQTICYLLVRKKIFRQLEAAA